MIPEYIYKFFKEKFKSLSKALKLQAKEYKRRLKDLNGEAKKLRDIQAEYIPREVFDRVVGELNARLDRLSNQLGERFEPLEKFKDKTEGRSQLLQYVPWVIAIIAIVATWYKK